MSTVDTNFRLSPTSYIVLGSLSLLGGEATPYTIKRLISTTIGPFWPFPHSQLYAEPDRLGDAGYVTVRQEATGRRRKLYKLSEKGRSALSDWRAEPVPEPFRHEDLAAMKLFFGGEPSDLAAAQIAALREALERIEEAKKRYAAVAPEGPLLVADLETRLVRGAIAFWSEFA